jgi:DNA-binding NarL/FixJ family response regulator
MTIGSFCVVDTEPRHWSTDDRQIMTTLAAAVISELALRSAHNHLRTLQRTLADQHLTIHAARRLVDLSQQLLLKDEHGPSEHWAHSTRNSLESLTEAVHHLMSTDTLDPASADNLSIDQLREKLTNRQVDVFDLLMRGLQTKEIARYLGLSPRTIEVHRSKILERLQISSFSSLLKQLLARPESH